MATPTKQDITLMFGQTVTGTFVPIRVGADGTLNGSTTGPAVDAEPNNAAILMGKTVTGTYVPIQVDSSGNVQLV